MLIYLNLLKNAKASLEKLGIADLLQKHSTWDNLQKPNNKPGKEDENEEEEEDSEKGEEDDELLNSEEKN